MGSVPISANEFSSCLEVKEETTDQKKVLKIYNRKYIPEVNITKYLDELKKTEELIIPHIGRYEEVKNETDYLAIKITKCPNTLETINPLHYFKDHGIAHVLISICECLEAFHRKGLIYGNLKPSNVLITENGKYVLSDYFTNLLTKNCEIEKEKLCYYSPEMIINEGINTKTDMWNLGCMIYYLMTGKKVFEGETTNEIKEKILNCEYKKLGFEYVRGYVQLIERLIRKDPNERITVKEVKDEIIKMNPIPIDLHPKPSESSKMPLCYEDNKAKGDEFYENGDYKEAINYFAEGMKYCETDNQKCYMNAYLGYSFLYLKNYNESVKYLNEAYRFASEEPKVVKLNICENIGKLYFTTNQFVEALPAFNEALTYTTPKEKFTRCTLYKYLGKTYYFLERFEESIEAFNESMRYCEEGEKSDDSNIDDEIKSDLTLSIGKSYFKTGKNKETLSSLTESLKYSKESHDHVKCEIYRHIGYAYLNIKYYLESLSAFRQAEKYCKDEPSEVKSNIAENIGNLYYLAEHYKEAIPPFEDTLKLAHRNEDDKFKYYKLLGKSYFLIKKYGKSVTAFKKAMHYFSNESEDEKVDIYLSLGISFFRNSQYEECINILTRSIKHAKDSKDLIKCEIFRHIGYSHYILKHYDESYAAFKEAKKYCNDESDDIKCDIYGHIGRIMFETNHFNEAISPLNKAASYSKDVSHSFKCEIFKLLGKSCYNIGRINDSIKSLVEATKYCKSESNEIKSDIYQSLGKAYQKNGDNREAKETFNEAIKYKDEINRGEVDELLLSGSWFFE